MRISKRNPIFILVSVLTFALGVFVTPVEQPNALELRNVLVVKYSPWQTLLKYENQDLLGLDERSTQVVEGAVEAITGRRDEDIHPRFEPALFRSMSNTEGETRYVLVEVAPLVMIPGNTTLRVHVFDTDGFLRNTQTFNAGYRTTVTSMRIRENNMLQQPLLIVDAEYCLGGHPSAQLYALTGNNMTLIYLEQDGQLDQNNYHETHMTIGPLMARSVAEWEKVLRSADEVEILSALVWFNGHHSEPALQLPDGVQKRLRGLSQSENYWIKTAAQSVLESKQ